MTIFGVAFDVIVVIVVCGTVHESAGQNYCPWEGVGRGFYSYGPECEYKCHCKTNSFRCDYDTGRCKEACENGFTGPGCQYNNWALSTNANGNVGSDYNRVVDGYSGSCSVQKNPSNNPYITVTLDTELYVNEVIITFKNYTAAAGFYVYAGRNTVLDQSTLCNIDPENDVTDETVSITCNRRKLARYVTILLEGRNRKLEICELEVISGRLVSFKKPTNSSSQESSPEKAVNGDPKDNFGTRQEKDPWWYVDLRKPTIMNLIEIIPRYDMRDYFIGFQILISNTSDIGDTVLIYVNGDTTNTLPTTIYIPIDDLVARYVWVFIPGEMSRLHMKEFSVFGGCRKHRCGLSCDDLCYCKDKVRGMDGEFTGRCQDGCERNWRLFNGFCDASLCGPGAFGYQCKYSCKCNGQCDPWTGQCLDPMNECNTHFYGPNCQALNLVRESTQTIQGVTVPGEGPVFTEAPASVDGRKGVCAATIEGSEPSWVVTLDSGRNISAVLVYINGSNTGPGLEVLTETPDDAVPCDVIGRRRGEYLGKCKNALATHLRIRARTSLQICEVAVLDCASGTFGPQCEFMCQCYNGQPCDKVTGECPSGGCEPGFYGDSCSSVCIPGSYGYNCSSECGYCNSGLHCDIFSGDCALPCASGWQGGRCDVECRNGTWGVDCLENCGFCLDGEPCNKETGECEEGCSAGYYGDDCTTECEPGTYGYNCNETCGNCTLNEACDPIDGGCRSGCILGLQPPLCKAECDFGTWGQDCKRPCGSCASNQTCNPYIGVCEGGCDPGVYVKYIDPMCNRVCPKGYHGYNCSLHCPTDICEDNDVCDARTGACLTGCLNPGYQAPRCTEQCWDGTYGYHCSQLCGNCKGRVPCDKITGICPFGCGEGYVGDLCQKYDPPLSDVSIVIIVLGVLLAIIGLLGIFLGLWIYKRGTLPWQEVKMRQKERKLRKEQAGRNFSIVSRVYENVNDGETEKAKRKNSNTSLSKVVAAKPRATLAVDELWNYVQDKKSTRPEIIQQFKDLAVGLTHPCEAAKKAQNLRKNRYKEIFAYDHSRVKLDVQPGDAGNDYINACYISGYNKPNLYIAAQGPTEEFVGDFWRMVWQKKCRKIVMLTRLVEHNKVKCSQYWPDDGEKTFGGVKVEIKDTDSFADFSIRTFSVSLLYRVGHASTLIKGPKP